MRSPAVYFSTEEHWNYVLLPDGKTIGYVEAGLLKRVAKYGPISVSGIREISDLVFDSRQVSSLKKKRMITQVKHDLRATSYGMEVLAALAKRELLEEVGNL